MGRNKKNTKVRQGTQEHKHQAEYEQAIKSPWPETWSTRRPAYVWMELGADVVKQKMMEDIK